MKTEENYLIAIWGFFLHFRDYAAVVYTLILSHPVFSSINFNYFSTLNIQTEVENAEFVCVQ